MSRISDFVAAVAIELDDDSVEFVIGKAKEGQHGQRRRVHWYRTEGDIDKNTRSGGTMTDTETTRTVAVWQREEMQLVRIFAESETTAETLLDNLVVAIDRTAGVSAVKWERYSWRENEIAQRGPMIELEFRLALPVADEITTLVVIEAVDTTTEFVESLDE
jgi:hypothetical protein